MRGDQQDLRDRLRRAALAAGGITAAMAGTEGGLRYLKDRAFFDANRPTRRFNDFVGKLEPGDIVFHRAPTSHSSLVKPINLGFAPSVNEAASMVAGKGDPFYHPSIHLKDGEILESAGFEKGISRSNLASPQSPEELLVMRARKRDIAAKAVREALSREGGDYKNYPDTIKHGLKHLAGVTEKPLASCAPGTLCSEFVADVYPSLFKDRLMSPFDMRHHPDLEFVARYAPTVRQTVKETALAHGVYPLLKNSKWGLLGGLGVLGASSLASMMNGGGE